MFRLVTTSGVTNLPCRYRLVVLTLSTIAALGVAMTPRTAESAIIVDDQFTDGGRSDGSDPLDISWFKNRASTQLSIVDDPVIGSGNALHVDIATFSKPSAHYIVGTFTPVTVGPTPGDKIRASFDFRFSGPVFADTGANFRLGILSSAGTAIEADGFHSTTELDDVGYGVSFEAAPSVFEGIKRHHGADIGGPGDPWLPTVTSGSLDNLGDTAVKHTATWTIERVTASSVQVTFQLDDLEAVTVDSAGNRIETFDELVVRGSLSRPLDFTIDNVRVETIQAVPEPATLVVWLLLGATFAVITGCRRLGSRV